ncbi:MAG TPA: hypothetical protein VNA15_12420 [Candidatus Angelobacter sp.]|nr:hypothetical protein [Candidatus Angelobacter sp.]
MIQVDVSIVITGPVFENASTTLILGMQWLEWVAWDLGLFTIVGWLMA